jgi:hypothetical protein
MSVSARRKETGFLPLDLGAVLPFGYLFLLRGTIKTALLKVNFNPDCISLI